MSNIGHERQQLLVLIRELAIVDREVLTASSGVVDNYINLRKVTLHHQGQVLVGRVMVHMLAGLHYVAVGGPIFGAAPVAASMQHAAASRGLQLDAFAVRAAVKEHGTQDKIEGPDIAGLPVLVVEDTSTTGRSVLQAVDAALEAGAEVVGVATVADREAGARAAIEARGLRFHTAFTLSEILGR